MKLEELALIDFVDQWGYPMVPKSYVAHIGYYPEKILLE